MNNITVIIVVLLVVLGSMILHELAHGVVAYLLGDRTAKEAGRLTLNPLKHLDPVLSVIMPLLLFLGGGPIFGGAKPVPVDARNLKHGVWGMALVALAGPLMNLLVAFVTFLVGYFTGAWSLTGNFGLGSYILGQILYVNLGFAVFNMIPIPPLDGSRVLYAVMPDAIRNFMEKIEPYGIFIVMILVVFVPSVISTVIGGGVTGILRVFAALVGAGNLFAG